VDVESSTRPAAATSPGAEPGAAFADKLSGPRAANVAAAGEPSRTGGVAVADLGAELRSGKLTSRAAVEQVLERVVARQIGPDAPAAVRDRVRAALQDALDADPLLAEKLRNLG
jgi:hypothetical protein